ncbi:MAG: serine O-acetyltransferase [Alphaproteobacteria bacterium]
MPVFSRLKEDIDVILEKDPAARSRLEVIFCYPGFHALLFHRTSHAAWTAGLKFVARFISHIARILTGIEIHPAATIGRRVFIDHGMGLVIGQTAKVGNDVTLYHGVTLGGISLKQEKRHPTIGDCVVVGSGAQILGPVTVGEKALIGANAVVLSDVPPGVTMVGIPARQVMARDRSGSREEFAAYGIPYGDLPDPVAKVLEGMMGEIQTLRARLDDVDGKTPQNDTQTDPDGANDPCIGDAR